MKRFSILGLAVVGLVAALPVAAQAAPKFGPWTAIAPAIDGPKVKVHTKIYLDVGNGYVEQFGKGYNGIAGGTVSNITGISSCAAPFVYLQKVPIHGGHFQGVRHLDGGDVIFKGRFTSATTAKGTWEETGPCFTNVIPWAARAGAKAPSPSAVGGQNSGGGPSSSFSCSPKPCGSTTGPDWSLTTYASGIDRNATAVFEGTKVVFMHVRIVNHYSRAWPPEVLDFQLKYANGQMSGWPADDSEVTLSNGSQVSCSWWNSPPAIPKGGSYSGNVCFTGSTSERAGALKLAFDPSGNNTPILIPLG